MNDRQLAMRDPAMAALLGVVALGGSDFGSEMAFDPNCFAPGDESDSDYGSDFGSSGFAFEGDFGHFGDDFGAAKAKIAVPKPTAQQALALWQKQYAKMAKTASRKAVLNPNAGSDVDIERYSMQTSETFVFGTAKTFTDLTTRPTVDFRPQVVTANAPSPMFAFMSAILVANVNVFVGQGEEDAFNYNANGWGKQLDMPTLTPAIPFTVNARYTGFTPPGFVGGTTNTFGVSVKGPASIVA